MNSEIIRVSVIVPARNAEATIGETLESLQAQVFEDWEAVVVDDGSTDSTATLVDEMTRADSRIRLIRLASGGVSMARNAAIREARFDYLLFLDSDDWILPEHLARLTAEMASHPGLDAVYTGWEYITAGGECMVIEKFNEQGDLFSKLATSCRFVIHSCLVRRAIVERAKGFDPAYTVCEDWDLWQRIARLGARFAYAPGRTARVRVRPLSASSDSTGLFRSALKVIETGHSRDPRLAGLVQVHEEGMPREGIALTMIYAAMWSAGQAVAQAAARGGELTVADELAAACDKDAIGLDEASFASCLFEGIMYLGMRRTAVDAGYLVEAYRHCRVFLAALQARASAPGVAPVMATHLERLILGALAPSAPMLVGSTFRIRIELTETIPDIFPPAGAERVRCVLLVGGVARGTLDLPVFDGCLPSSVLSDAIASELAWPLLGEFFNRNLYPMLEWKPEERDFSVWRGRVKLASGVSRSECDTDALHDRIGWTVLLQEIWEMPGGDSGFFYDPRSRAEGVGLVMAGEWISLEIGGDVPEVQSESGVWVAPSIAGSALGAVRVDSTAGVVTAQQLRVAITQAAGMELCRVAVREGLLGEPLDGGTLHRRLEKKAGSLPPAPRLVSVPRGVSLAATAGAGLAQAAAPHTSSLVLGARIFAPMGTSASRLAALPASALASVIAAAKGEGLPAIQVGEFRNGAGGPVVYSPGVVWRPENHAGGSHAAAPHRNGKPHAAAPADPSAVTEQIPILMYHRVAPSGSQALSRFRVPPDLFERHVRHLAEAGYRTIGLDEWRAACHCKRPIHGRAVILTFDDGYRDFRKHAWPILRRYGFTAYVFLVTAHIGGFNEWDQAHEKIPLLNADEIARLRDEGVYLGSHTTSHPRLIALSGRDALGEMLSSRMELSRAFRIPADTIAYPYGETDEVVAHLAGACGYVYGLSAKPGLACFHHSLLALPRIEIAGTDNVEKFTAKLKGE